MDADGVLLPLDLAVGEPGRAQATNKILLKANAAISRASARNDLFAMISKTSQNRLVAVSHTIRHVTRPWNQVDTRFSFGYLPDSIFARVYFPVDRTSVPAFYWITPLREVDTPLFRKMRIFSIVELFAKNACI